MIAPLLRYQSSKRDGALLAMAPEQVIQHYRNWGVPERRGRSPRSEFLMLSILLTSID